MKRAFLLFLLSALLSLSALAQTTRSIGAGSPEGVVTAGKGSTYSRTDCTGTADCFYIKTTDATVNTGWVAVDPSGSGGGISALTGDVTASGTGSVAAIIANNAVSDGKFRQSAGLSVVGRASNSTGNVADITASNDGEVLRRSGTSVGFGTLATAGLGDSQVTYAKIQNVAANRIVGNATGSAGALSEIPLAGSLAFSTGNLQLNGDSSSPGNSKYYGTDGSGTKGFFDLPSGSGGANQALSNLASVAINTTLVSDTDNTDDLGTSASRWRNLYLADAVRDGNGNEIFKVGGVSSAVNELTFKSSVTGQPPTIEATGGDSDDIGIYLKVKNGSADTTSGQIYGDPMVRYDYPTYSFYHASNAFRAYGMGLNSGGGWLSITGPNISLQAGDGAAGIVALQGLSILGFSERNSTGIDCPQCQVVGIKKGSRHSIAVVGSDYPADGDFPNGATLNFPASTPSQITGNQNDFNPGTFSYNQHWSSDASRNVTGLLTSSTQDSVTVTQVDGQIHRIWNVGAQNIVLKHQDTGSSATNRFLSSTGADITLAANECAEVQYHGGSVNRWRLTPCATAGSGGGSVTTVSVVSANGFAGSVANATTTPAITLTTTITGVLKGNGTAVSAASSGTDYVAPGAATGSGLTMATSRILGRTTASTGAIEELTASGVLDIIGSTRGSVLYRGASGWAALTPGTSGHVLTSNGAGADPTYQAGGGGGGANTGLSNLASVAINATLATGAGVTFAGVSTAPAAANGATQAGIPLTLTASPAVASLDTAGAAAGGTVTITGGAAARLTSGNANGGNINLTPGAGIGTGTTGAVVITAGNLAFGGTSSTNLAFISDGTTGGAFRRADNSNLSGIIAAGSWYAGAPGSYKAIVDAGNTLDGISIASNATLYFSSSTSANGGLADLSLVRAGTNTLRAGRGSSAGVSALNMGRLITAKTSNYTVVVNDSNTLFTNTGASGTVNYTLPTAAVGLTYGYYVDAAQTLQVTAGASTTIRSGSSVTSAGGNITNATPGGMILLTAISTTQWIAEFITGTWTFN